MDALVKSLLLPGKLQQAWFRVYIISWLVSFKAFFILMDQPFELGLQSVLSASFHCPDSFWARLLCTLLTALTFGSPAETIEICSILGSAAPLALSFPKLFSPLI